jgi:hypothetical protein
MDSKLTMPCVEGEAVSGTGATVFSGVDGLDDDDEFVATGVAGKYVDKRLTLLRIVSNISSSLVSCLIEFCGLSDI